MKGDIITSRNRLIVLDDVVQIRFVEATYSTTSGWTEPSMCIYIQKASSDVLEIKINGDEAREVWDFIKDSKGLVIPVSSQHSAVGGSGLLQSITFIEKVKLLLLNPSSKASLFD